MQSGSSSFHGLSADDSRQLSQRVLGYASADQTRVNIESGLSAFTRVAINRITTAGEATDVTVQVTSVFGKRVASVETNRLDDESLRRTVQDAEALAKLAPENPEYQPELGEQTYIDVAGYYQTTGGLTTESRATSAALGIAAAEKAGAVAAGFIDVRAGSSAVATSNGLFAYHAGTGVASTVTIRTRDGQSSGWAGDEGADWASIESQRIAEDALKKCNDWRGRTALEPGTYDVVLEPTAVGMLLSRLPQVFDARQADEGRSFFARRGGGNRLGERIFDPRVTIVSNPAEPNAETDPFTSAGLPIGREVWVENGVLRTLAYSRFWATKQGVTPRSVPTNLIVSGGDATVEDMIASTKRGVLITRFWYIRPLNPRTVAYTGLTRDGTFLIENGRISRPVTNFRFNQSLMALLANVEMVGRPTRIAAVESGATGMPVVTPALKVRDFLLSSVSDAI
jgi:predicted Zn-dependent protease